VEAKILLFLVVASCKGLEDFACILGHILAKTERQLIVLFKSWVSATRPPGWNLGTAVSLLCNLQQVVYLFLSYLICEMEINGT
jgi:hypothetical protein